MKPKLTGDRCECSACGLYFSSTNSFDRHRNGSGDARRCLSADELTAKGWAPNAKGFWRIAQTGAPIARKAT